MTAPDQLVGWVAGAIGFCMAVYERLRTSKKQDKTEAEQELVSDAKRQQERANLLGKSADENLELFKKEQAEHQRTRDFWHEKSGEFQNTLSKCQDKLAEVSARPDYSEMLLLLKKQGEHIERMLKVLERPEILASLQQRAA